jgi:hypothetical protein
MDTKSLISVLELKRLLVTIIDFDMPICIRYRILGEMWQSNFLRVVKVTEKGVILNDELRNKTIILQDLTQIIQFEIDGRIHNFQPHFHYDVSLKEVLS